LALAKGELENKVANISATPDIGPSLPPSRTASPDPSSARNDASRMLQSQADLRLVIEEDTITGSYVYKTVDRQTGEIVAQIPREDVLQMRERNYAAGDLIRTRA
jgi:flagellar protein FlaG